MVDGEAIIVRSTISSVSFDSLAKLLDQFPPDFLYYARAFAEAKEYEL